MKRKVIRERDGRWCEVEIKLDDGSLSITGSEGEIISYAKAKREARELWKSYYKEIDGEERREVNKRLRVRSANGFAACVARIDGDLHGLEVHDEDGDRIFVTQSCGCIHDTLIEWFPEVEPLIPWHLNNMRPDCIHQKDAVRAGYRIGDECEVCGHKYGSVWLKRELPKEIVELAETVCSEKVE